MRTFMLSAMLLCLTAGCSQTTDVDNSTVKELDMERFLGRWYEIARFDHRFERNMEYTEAEYSLRDDGNIDVVNTGIKNGKRKNDEAVPSGLSIYDLDHITNPRAKWDEIEPRKEELGIVLAHVSPSTEGLRLVFVIPQGMTLPEAQAWMAKQLGDTQYDACVKDYARCSFAVPREYVLFMDVDLITILMLFINVLLSWKNWKICEAVNMSRVIC